MPTGFITHPIYWQHETGAGHPEAPTRLTVIRDHLIQTGLSAHLTLIEPTRRADLHDWIARVHTASYYNTLQQIPSRGYGNLDPDTPFAPMSLDAASMATSGLLMALDQVMMGALTNAFCALRPPGHHAMADRAMGFCLINHVAVGARYLQKQHACNRILIVDWDAHHGNGTQALFYDDPTVFYFSTHQYPFYPGTGARSERGTGEGEGATCNCPLAAGSGDKEILQQMEKMLVPAMTEFRPDFVLISAGFDAHRDDPLAQLDVTEDGFTEMTRLVKSLAETHCHGRMVSVLEGGYHPIALAQSVGHHLEALL